MENKKIIALSGKQYSGKDTLTSLLIKTLNANFIRVGIGDAIKSEFSKRKNLTIEEIEKNKHIYRQELINLGNEGRAISNTYWLERTLTLNDSIIISDMRLKKEYDFYKSVNAICIRVESNREERLKRGNLTSENDLTETDLDNIENWDYIFYNNSNLENLQTQVLKFYNSFYKNKI